MNQFFNTIQMKNLSKAILAFGFIVLIFSLHKITQSKAQDGLPILWDKESYLKEFQEKTAQADNLILTKSKAIPLKSKIALTGTITITGINVSDCNSADNTYSIDVTISYSGVSGDISVNGTSFTPDGTSPDTFTISGLNSTGIMGNCVTAASVNTPSCNDQSFYNAPAPCQAPPTIYNIATEDGNTVTSCNGIFVDSGGSGSDYADNENYNVTFCSGSSEKIILDFTAFDVEPDGTCQYDKISIYDGTSTSDPLIGEYCGTNSPGIVVSSDSCLHIVFVSDGGATRPGWEANIFCESNYIYNTNSCRNTVLINNGYEDTGSATFGSTFEGYPAEVLAGSGPNPIPQWFNNFTECSSGCNGYWIYDNTNTINNPDGQYFAWLNGDNDCFSQYGIDVTNGTCYQICVDAAAWSNPGPQDTTHLFVEVRGSSIYGGSLQVIYDQVLPASTSFTDLNWQKICFNWTAPGNDNIEFIISQRNTSTGLLIDRVCMNEVNCSATSISSISLSNQSTCNNNGTSNSDDDYYTADVIVSFTNPAPSGSLILTGNTFASESVGNLDGPTSHTFMGVRLPANGETTSIMAFFDQHNGNEYVLCDIPAVNSCSGFCPTSISSNITLLIGELLDSGGGRTEIINFDKTNPTMCPTPLPDGGEGMAYDRNRDAVWIVDFNTDEIVLYDMTTQQVTHRITGYPCVFDIALSNDGNYLYGASCNDIFRIDISNLSSPTLSGLRVDSDFTGQGKLWGVAVDPTTGDVYVSKGFQAPGSSYTSTISRLAANLTGTITTFASISDGGIFMGLTFDPSNNLWAVKDGSFTVNDAIMQFNTSGTVLQNLSWMPGLTTDHSSPNDLAIGPDGDIYVATYFEYCVLRYNIGPGTWEEYLPYAPGAGGKIIEFVCGEIACKPCISSSLYSDNCSGASIGPFTADWQFIVNAPDSAGAEVQWSRNGSSFTDFTLVTDIDTITIAGIPADGGAYDTLVVRYKNKITCSDTIIVKRPNPCPPDVSPCSNLSGCLAGKVFNDFNFNGVNESTESGIQGVKVIIFDNSNNPVGTTYSDTDGDWQFCSLTDGNDYRVEFIVPERISCWAKPTPVGSSNGSNIQFSTAPNCVNFSLSNPADYCQIDADVIVPCFLFGNPLSHTGREAIISDPYNDRTGPPHVTTWATMEEVGTTYGVAYDKKTDVIYAAAYARRYTGFGPGDVGANGSSGAIYQIDRAGNVSVLIDIDPASPSNPNPGLYSTGPNIHPNTTTNFNCDPMWFEVGMMSWGDIDINEDGTQLYAMNMYDRALYIIDTRTGAILGRHIIPGITGGPTWTEPMCSNDPDTDLRPMATKYRNGKVYIGITCAAMSTGSTNNDLGAFVWAFDLASGQYHPSSDLYIDLSLNATDWNSAPHVNGSTRHFYEWYNPSSGVYNTRNPNPILADLEFDGDDLILGFRNVTKDRIAAVTGTFLPDCTTPQPTNGNNGGANGRVLRACYNGSRWIMESGGSCGGVTGFGSDGYTGANGNAWTTYYEQFNSHFADYSGAIAIHHGENDVLTVGTTGGNQGGVMFIDQADFTSLSPNGGEAVIYSNAGSNPFAKTNGLGDVELACNPAPLEIGNYVWQDSNNNGIQDASESGISNVNITLYIQNGSGCDSITTIQTNASGEYYFND